MHDVSLLATIAAGFAAAWLLGLLAQRFGLSPIVGYLSAGILIGPHTPGFVGDVQLAQQLAEVGVILLMFGVGLHFNLKDLLAVRKVATTGAVGQSLIATLAAMAIFSAFGMPLRSGAVLGMAMAVASTVVLMRVLMDANMLDSPQGHVAVGWLIVEDIFTVVLLVLIPVLGQAGEAGENSSAIAMGTSITIAMLKLGALVAIVLVAGARVLPWVLVKVARLRSRELFTLTVLVFSIVVAVGAYYAFGASMALGAFLAGMVVGQSPVSHQAAADALPLRDAFAVLFFVSVGMLFDPAFLFHNPLMLVAALGIVLLIKPLTALVIVAVLGHSVRTALTVALGLSQIGEFSFILSDLARRHGLMPDTGHNALVAAAIISISLNPSLFRTLPRIERKLKSIPWLWSLLNSRAERLTAERPVTVAAASPAGGAIVVGYGPVGRAVHRLLRDAQMRTTVIDLNMETVSALQKEGQNAIFGDASSQQILEEAGLETASYLVVTAPEPAARAAIVAAARSISGRVRIFARARYLQERDQLEHAGVTAAVFEEAEAAIALARMVLSDTGLHRQTAEKKLKDLRLQLIFENISNIGAQHVRSVMVPWSRVHTLPASASRTEVLARISRQRFSRWPVVESQGRRPTGYLLTKDLVASSSEDDWRNLVRPLSEIRSDDSIESALRRMQVEGATVYVVQDQDRPVGLLTLEDILEQVVGRIEDEYPHEAPVSLVAAAERGGVLLDIPEEGRDEILRTMVQAIPRAYLPAEVDHAKLLQLVLQREAELSTDLGNGAAIPHARCPRLEAPVVVIARVPPGVASHEQVGLPIRIWFLLITSIDQPEAQLALLSQVAGLWADETAREGLLRADSPADVLTVLATRERMLAETIAAA